MRAGASGFLVKESAGEELVVAINQVLQGRWPRPSGHGRRDGEDGRSGSDRAAVDGTTARCAPPYPAWEAHEGDRGNAQSVNATVETHKYQMMEVLGVHSTTELVRYAIEHRLIVD